MAEKLSITIALSGAEEIKRQLAEVGKAGKDAFNDINKAAADVGGFNKLDAGAVTAQLEKAGVAGKDVAKVLNAVNQAGRMETLVNGLKSVESGFANIQAAASSMDQVLLKGLTRSLSIIARLLPTAFAAATVGAIANTTKAILELDAAALKAGVSIGEMAKAQEIFKQIGLSSKEAAQGAAEFIGKLNLEKVKDAVAAIDEFGRVSKAGDFFKILEEAAKGTGEAADLARKKLQELGRLDVSPAARSIDEIKKSAMNVPDQLLAMLDAFQRMGNTAERNRLIFANFSATAATALIEMLNAGVSIDQIRQKLASLPPVTQAAADAAARVALEWQNLKNLFASGFTVSVEGLNQVAAVLAAITTSAQQAAMYLQSIGMQSMFGNTIRELETIGQLLTNIGQLGISIWSGIAQAAASAWGTVIGWIQDAIAAVRQFFSMGGGQAAGAGASGMARGGLMGGRGSGTSDSNLAWLSRGEHVMPAYAVRQPGVLQLLEALRRSGGNLRGVLDRMGHFAMGGLVGAPAFAGGGINGMSHVTIAFPGLPPVGGLRASSAVVDELRRSAALAQVRAGGRKPSRYT